MDRERSQRSGATEGPTRNRARRWRERERPAPSTIWQTVGVTALFSAVGTAIAALTVAPGAPVSRRELWIVTSALVVWGVTLLIAHWEVNRGRSSRQYEREELSPPDLD